MWTTIKSKMANIALKFISVEEKLTYMFLESFPKHVHPIVILPAVNTCMNFILKKMEKKSIHGLIHNGQINGINVSVIQTQMGSPSTAMIMEVLNFCECKTVIRMDYCGGLKTTFVGNNVVETQLDIGSVVVPKQVFLTDGTSMQYLQQYVVALRENSLFHDHQIKNATSWKYPNLDGKYWSVECDPSIYDIFTSLNGYILNQNNPDLLWATDSLFCEPKEAMDVWKSYGCNSVDMESSAVYLLGALFKIPVISVLGVSDLSDSEEYNLFKVNKIHPGVLQSLSVIYNLLYDSLPKIQRLGDTLSKQK